MNIPNRFDRYSPDVLSLIRQQEAYLSSYKPKARSDESLTWLDRHLRYPLRLRLVTWLKRSGIYDVLLRTHLLTDWFEEFKSYWVDELGNRPIDIPDFYFLRGVYRARFQDVALPSENNDNSHLETWQRAETVYLLFQSQWCHRASDLSQYLRFIPRGGHVCEYGCGIAPVSVWLVDYAPHFGLVLTFADIPTLNFHFARWRLRDKPYARAVEIHPDEDSPLDEEYDVIFLLAVLEHLPRPLKIVQHLYDRLRPGGYLIFDYIKSEGRGLDASSSLAQREEVFQWIRDHFDVVVGHLKPPFESFYSVVCRKPEFSRIESLSA